MSSGGLWLSAFAGALCVAAKTTFLFLSVDAIHPPESLCCGLAVAGWTTSPIIWSESDVASSAILANPTGPLTMALQLLTSLLSAISHGWICVGLVSVA